MFGSSVQWCGSDEGEYRYPKYVFSYEIVSDVGSERNVDILTR